MLLLHGFCETHEIWNDLTSLPLSGLQLVAIDLPGFGQSPLPPAPFSLDEIGRRILEWIDAQGLHRPALVGHSLGGYVALAMAARSPDSIGALALLHSTPYPDSPERKANRDRVISFVQQHGVGPFVDTFVPSLFYDRHHPAVHVVDAIARQTSADTLVAYAAAMRDRPSSAGVIAALKAPVMIFGGENDAIVTADVTVDMAKLNPHTTLHLVPHTGHMGMFECPDLARKALGDFLKTAPIG